VPKNPEANTFIIKRNTTSIIIIIFLIKLMNKCHAKMFRF